MFSLEVLPSKYPGGRGSLLSDGVGIPSHTFPSHHVLASRRRNFFGLQKLNNHKIFDRMQNMRQTYSQDILQGIIDQYRDIGAVKDSHLFTSGFENSNYYVETEKGKFVIKVFEGLDIAPESILFEVNMMDKLYNAGVKTPKIFQTKNRSLHASLGQKYAVLMNYIEGENMDKHTISDALAKQIGEQAGKMDSTLQTIRDGSKTRQNYEFDLKNFLILESKLEELDSRFDKNFFVGIFQSFKKIESSLDSLPSGLIQNDIVLHNILAKDDELTGIIDFSDMVFSPYIQTVAVAFSQCFFTYNWQPHQAKIFLKGYQKFHPLSSEELGFLRILTLARFATLVVEFNHWNVVFGDDSQRTEFINDNYEFLKKFLQINESEFQIIIA
jgi:Ser/Thr protein kinase RdoA (MazF antagonist)